MWGIHKHKVGHVTQAPAQRVRAALLRWRRQGSRECRCLGQAAAPCSSPALAVSHLKVARALAEAVQAEDAQATRAGGAGGGSGAGVLWERRRGLLIPLLLDAAPCDCTTLPSLQHRQLRAWWELKTLAATLEAPCSSAGGGARLVASLTSR